jgi:branched-chain amino acid transport system substrate-binding protein
MLGIGLSAVKGDIAKRSELVAAMEKARIDSPRGTFTLSKSHEPVQDIYLRKVVGTENHVEGVAVTALADPSPGCKM